MRTIENRPYTHENPKYLKIPASWEELKASLDDLINRIPHNRWRTPQTQQAYDQYYRLITNSGSTLVQEILTQMKGNPFAIITNIFPYDQITKPINHNLKTLGINRQVLHVCAWSQIGPLSNQNITLALNQFLPQHIDSCHFKNTQAAMSIPDLEHSHLFVLMPTHHSLSINESTSFPNIR